MASDAAQSERGQAQPGGGDWARHKARHRQTRESGRKSKSQFQYQIMEGPSKEEMKVLTKCPKCLSFSQTYKLLGWLLY